MDRVFIAGATGYFGRHLCAEYQRRGWYVIALVGKVDQAGLIAADQLIEAEATDPVTLKGVMAGADLVVSCLGITRQTNRLDYWDVDYQANLNLLREAKRAGIGQFCYVHVLDAGERSHVPMDTAKSTFMAELQRYAIAATVITPNDGNGPARFVLGASAFDTIGMRHRTRSLKDHFENNFAPINTASIHQITAERK